MSDMRQQSIHMKAAALVFCLLAIKLMMTLPAIAQSAQKAFIRDDIAISAASMEEKLKREIKPGTDATRLLREAMGFLNKKEPRAALPLFNQLVLMQPQSAATWRLIARAARRIEPKDWQERYDMQERATAAAYLAYQRALTKPEEAASLDLLADVFVWREMWRPALSAYRIALEAEENAEIRKTYEELREKRGFRLSGNEVDADSASPRACFTFSEPLARGRVDFAPYVAVTGKGDFAISAEDRQICVEGLRHGEHYGIVLRTGIPSVIPGETLLKTGDYNIYVRDRKASVRSGGKTYVLPRTAQQGVPLVSVNTSKVGVRILRIGDRNLVNTVRSPEFLEQLENYQIKKLIEETGQRVWQGEMDVKSELNKDITTAFPVLEAAGKLDPGVYLMVAEPDGLKPPSAASTEENEPGETPATQWFVVSDLGLSAFTGADGVHVLVRGLANAKPVADAEIRLIARNNEVLGTAKTNAAGHAVFDAGLSRGIGGLAPGIVTAQLKEDYGFLDMQQSAFDLTDRGVSGRIAPRGLDAFVYAERGVYRPGESVYLSALLRDARGVGVAGMPLTLLVRRPDGMEYRRVVVEDQGGGGRAITVSLLSGVPTGTWRALVYSDPKRPAIGETTFLVEDYVPERLELLLSAKTPAITSGGRAEIDANVRYLYGAPGAELQVSGETTVRVAKSSAIPGFAGYRTGLEDEPVEAIKTPIEENATTDAAGKATLSIEVKEPETNLPLEAEFAITASETGGRGITRSLTLPITPKGAAIGVKPLFIESELGDGDTAKFAVIMATGAGKRLARSGLKWQLLKVSRNYQWYFKDGRWAYEAIKTQRRVADGEIASLEAAPVEIAAKVGWGTYRIELRAGGTEEAETGFNFSVGYQSDAKADTPDVLDVVLDKKGYKNGETMQVRLAPRFAGNVTLAVMSDRLAHLQTLDVPSDGITVPLKVSDEWGAGAYLVALAHRPLDAAAQRMPGRAIGLSWFAIDREARKLEVALGTPALIRPRSTMTLPVKIANLKPGEEVFVTLSAVDVGILNLTRYASPNPSEHFFGQRQLSAELRDLYAYLIDGMAGVKGAIRSGGDAPPDLKGEKPTQEPLARFSGVLKAGPDGSVPVSFELPAFNGTIRVMAVAWSKDRTGETSADVIVRDPIIVQPTTPRFLALGDRSRFSVEINNVEGETGDYTLDIDVKGPINVALDPALRKIRLARGAKTTVAIPVTSAGIGMAEIDLRLTGGGHELKQSLRLPLRGSAPTLANRTVRPLPAGQSLTLSNDLLAEFVPGTGSLSVTASLFAALEVPQLLASLDRYPYGCTEQTVSRALPLLYVNRLASMENLGLDNDAESRITGAIERILARQGANGAFGLWGIGGEDLWLDAFVADFLTRARERNFAVPQVAFSLALDRLRNQVTNAGEIRAEEAPGIAYAIYVLARNGRPIIGDLRYLADNKLKEFDSPLAKGQLGAALALLGDRGRASSVFEAAQTALAEFTEDGEYRADYGSKLRDSAGLLALFAEGNAEKVQLARLSAVLEGARQASKYTSTQEQTWMVLAAQALQKEAEALTLNVDGTSQRGAFYRNMSAARLEGRPLTLRNESAGDARVMLSVSGIPLAPEPALAQGYEIARSIHKMGGELVGNDRFEQNERYVVVLKIKETAPRDARLLIVDPLPAGLEIENAKLGDGASLEGLSEIIGEATPTQNVEARDDRFVAALDRKSAAKKQEFTLAYIVRAVTPGRYVHPAAFVEDMYRPEKFGRTGFGTLEISTAAPVSKRP